MTATRIRLIPELSVAALRAKLDKELSLWYCLRAINHWGSGRLDHTKTIDALTHDFHYSKSAAYRILRQGAGKFWDIRDIEVSRIIYLRGLEKTASYLQSRCHGHFLEIAIEDFVGDANHRVAAQRSWLYASFHRPQGADASPISRASVHKATGVGRRSQQRYEKVTVKSIENFADKQQDGKLVPILELVSGKRRQWLVHKQLGNTYRCMANKGARGMLSKVNTAVTQSFVRGEAWVNRRFFTSVKSYLKSPNRYPDSYLLVNPKGRMQSTRSEWCLA
jgi:hypothetical protein